MSESNNNIYKSSKSNKLVKEEDFSWIHDDDEELKKKYMLFPLSDWKNIIKKFDFQKIEYKANAYQDLVNMIVQNDIFKNQQVKGEDNIYNLLDIFDTTGCETEGIKPDFIISTVPVETFLEIIKERNYMLRYDENFNKFDNIEFINIIGESKVNPERINDKNQKDKYLKFCEQMNHKFKHTYFMLMYVFDVSFKKFWEKNFFFNNPIIIGYIPQLYNEICYEIQSQLKANDIKKTKNRYAKKGSHVDITVININNIKEFTVNINTNKDNQENTKEKTKNLVGDELLGIKGTKYFGGEIENNEKLKTKIVDNIRLNEKEKHEKDLDLLNEDINKMENLLNQKRERKLAMERKYENKTTNYNAWKIKDEKKEKEYLEQKNILKKKYDEYDEKKIMLENLGKKLQLNEKRREEELKNIYKLEQDIQYEIESIDELEDKLRNKKNLLNEKSNDLENLKKDHNDPEKLNIKSGNNKQSIAISNNIISLNEDDFGQKNTTIKKENDFDNEN